jgi:hypothetical protein
MPMMCLPVVAMAAMLVVGGVIAMAVVEEVAMAAMKGAVGSCAV